jgi:hypothetical protein
MHADLRVSFACGPYDRTQALRDGSIKPEGIELTYVTVSALDRGSPHSAAHRDRKIAALQAARLRRWPNYRELEQDYYRRTKIYPIM